MNVFHYMRKLDDILYKSLPLLQHFFNCHIAAFFKTSVLKEVRILHYLHNESVVLIQKFENKAMVYFIR